jgi:hypothetical protein
MCPAVGCGAVNQASRSKCQNEACGFDIKAWKVGREAEVVQALRDECADSVMSLAAANKIEERVRAAGAADSCLVHPLNCWSCGACSW